MGEIDSHPSCSWIPLGRAIRCVSRILMVGSVSLDCRCCRWIDDSVSIRARRSRRGVVAAGSVGMRDRRRVPGGITLSSAGSKYFWSTHNTCYVESLKCSLLEAIRRSIVRKAQKSTKTNPAAQALTSNLSSSSALTTG